MDRVLDRILPWPVAGALAGFVLGFFAYVALRDLGAPLPGVPGVGGLCGGLVGAVCGGFVGSYLRRPAAEGGTAARWCVGMMLLVGGVSFLAGFVGPMLLRPDAPQGPLLGIFFTGPLGAVAGAVVGLLIGLVRQGQRPQGGSRPIAWPRA
jgi:hypothetical protein